MLWSKFILYCWWTCIQRGSRALRGIGKLDVAVRIGFRVTGEEGVTVIFIKVCIEDEGGVR